MARCRALGFVIAALALAAGEAHAAVGDANYRDCHSGELNLIQCTPIAGATPTGADSGIGAPQQLAVSATGTSVYVVSRGEGSVARFARGAAGALAYRDCVGADSGSPCRLIPGAAPDADGTGMDSAEDLALSPDGAHLYVSASRSDSVARFGIAGGALNYVDCVSGDATIAGCAKIRTATANGAGSGVSDPDGIAISPNGRFVYVLSSGDNGVGWYIRGPSGALSFRGCLTADSEVPACEQLPFAVPSADDTGFDSLREIAISPDGRSLYLADDSDESVATFSIGPDGAPSFEGCLSGQTTILPCDPIPGANATGADTGLRSLVDVTVSPDGNSVYAVSDSDEALAHFARDPRSGELSFAGCHSGQNDIACTPIPTATPNGTDSGMQDPTVARVAPDGRSVQLSSSGDDALASFVRDPRDGTLSYRGCISGAVIPACAPSSGASADGAESGFDQVRAMTHSADATSVYVSAIFDSAVARFDREPDAAGPRLKLRAAKKQRGRRAKARIKCRNEFCPLVRIRGTMIVDKRKGDPRQATAAARISLGPVTRRNQLAGGSARASLKLGRRARRLLRRSGRAEVKLRVRGGDLLDNRTIRRKRIVLKPPR